MTPRQRSFTGTALALLLVPVVLGLMACLPVPLGDPERSRVDAAMNGVYANRDGDPGCMIFEPFDKRTWLVTYLYVDRETRRAYERVIRKHIASDGLYVGESRKFVHVGGRDIEIVAGPLEDLINHDRG